MMDEIFDRNYQSGRAHLNAGIDRALARVARSIAASFKALHRVEWSSPWTAADKARSN